MSNSLTPYVIIARKILEKHGSTLSPKTVARLQSPDVSADDILDASPFRARQGEVKQIDMFIEFRKKLNPVFLECERLEDWQLLEELAFSYFFPDRTRQLRKHKMRVI